MRDKRFITAHRGGLLTGEDHRKLMWWARQCCLHVLPLLGAPPEERLADALSIAEAWEAGQVKVGIAMKASVAAHAVAREQSNPTAVAIARAIGQTVATAHMADHSLGGALYALKAVQAAGRSVQDERAWQNLQLQKLPAGLVALVHTTLQEKAKALRSFESLLS